MNKKNIAYIEYCNFEDYPLGGHLSFAKHLVSAMEGEISLIGCTTNKSEPICQWFEKNIDGYVYRLFNLSYVNKISFRKPFIPARITSFLACVKGFRRLDLESFDTLIVQTPEVLFALPQQMLSKVCLVMPGIENPLSISKYRFARRLSSIYDHFFFSRASKVRKILAAADNNSICQFIARSQGLLHPDDVLQFPTRYDASIFGYKDKATLRAQYAFPSSALLVVTTGRLGWFKGWKFLMDAFLLFCRQHPDAHFCFIGDGEDRGKLEAYILANNCGNRVTILGRVDQSVIADYLNMADLFVMGSYKEGWSTALVEAVASGIACVVTDFSSARDLIREGDNGYVVEARQEVLFAERMEQSLQLDPARIRERAAWCEKFSLQKLKTELTAIIG